MAEQIVPSTYMSRFTVRSYECDAYGHLNNVNYVRYVQEAGLEADAAVGYGLNRRSTLGRRWQTRRLEIEYLRPARYGDTIAVQVTSSMCGATTLRRDYRLSTGDGGILAQAAVEASWLDAATGLPAPMPPDLASAFSPHNPEGGLKALGDLPPLPVPPLGVFSIRHRVSWQDLDMTRRVADVTMLGFTEACGMGVVAAHGWPPARMAAEGFAIILRRHRAEFLASAALDDELEVSTWASEVRRVSATRHYTIRRTRDGALLARFDTLGVWVELATGRPVRIPSHFLADFAPNLVKAR